jgi:hypothetical protein
MRHVWGREELFTGGWELFLFCFEGMGRRLVRRT